MKIQFGGAQPHSQPMTHWAQVKYAGKVVVCVDPSGQARQDSNDQYLILLNGGTVRLGSGHYTAPKDVASCFLGYYRLAPAATVHIGALE